MEQHHQTIPSSVPDATIPKSIPKNYLRKSKEDGREPGLLVEWDRNAEYKIAASKSNEKGRSRKDGPVNCTPKRHTD